MTVPNLLVQLDDTSGAFVHNVTAYVHLPSGVETKRGRNDEDDTVAASELKLRLDNVDGRFTLGSTTYGIRIDQRIRVTETVGATTSIRFTGYVEDWPTSWPSPSASHAVTYVTAVDRLARLERRKLAGTFLDTEMAADAPFGRWPLRDAEGSTTAGDVSGNARPTLTPQGTGTLPVFTGAGVTFMGGKYLTARPAGTVLAGFEVMFSRTSIPSTRQCVMALNTTLGGTLFNLVIEPVTGQASMGSSGGPTVTTSASVCDGAPHHAFIANDDASLTASLYIDGVLVGSSNHTVVQNPMATMTVGGSVNPSTANFAGTASDFAVYTTAPSAARIAVHADAVLTGLGSDSSDERIARLAAYANLAPADLSLEAGVLTSVPTQQIDGVAVLESMRDVAESEGGVLFVNGSGQLVLQNRTHRVMVATSAADMALTSADIGDPVITGDKQYLENYITGSREGGATQVALNQASIDQYDQYPNDIRRALYTSDEQVADLINWRVAQYGEPRPRMSSVTLDLQQAALGLELGDRITVSGLPVQSPIETADLLVEGWTETVTDQSWDMVLNTVPAEGSRAWLLGNATYGVLDSTTRLYY
jgi:hypothetical protein